MGVVQWLSQRLSTLEAEVRAKHIASAQLGQQYSEEITQYMRQNAPWEDVTGEARRQLKCNVILHEDVEVYTVQLSLQHGVDYGAILETMQAGRFAILRPTHDAYVPKITAAYHGLWGLH